MKYSDSVETNRNTILKYPVPVKRKRIWIINIPIPIRFLITPIRLIPTKYSSFQAKMFLISKAANVTKNKNLS